MAVSQIDWCLTNSKTLPIIGRPTHQGSPMKLPTKHKVLAGLTLFLGVGLNAFFLYTNTHPSIAAAFALAEIAFFSLVPNWYTAILKGVAQVLSVTITFMLFASIIQDDTQAVSRHAMTTTNTQMQINQIDARLTAIQIGSYISADPEYQDAHAKLNNRLTRLKNTQFKYYGKPLPESFWEASNGCTKSTSKSAKVTRDYPSVCSNLKRTTDELTALDVQYNSESNRQSELNRLQSKRNALVADSPNLGQNNLKGLTDNLSGSLNISGLADNLMLIMAFVISCFIGLANMVFSLRLATPVEFDPENMRTGQSFVGYDSEQVLSSLLIPPTVKVNTDADGKFALVLAETVRHHTTGMAVNKKTIQSYQKCSNDIAQAVINTLAHNNLLEKDNQSWQWK